MSHILFIYYSIELIQYYIQNTNTTYEDFMK